MKEHNRKQNVIQVYIFATIVSLFIFLMRCTRQTNGDVKDLKIEELQNQVKSYEKNINELQGQISSYELEIKTLKEESDDYKKFVASSMKYLNNNELLALAKKEWSYSISVDGKLVEADDVLEIDKSDFKITYSETQSGFSALPSEIHNEGSMSGNFFDHIKILDKKPNNTELTDGTVVQGMIYEFQNVQKGTVIKLEISNELKERLAFKTNTINIYVK